MRSRLELRSPSNGTGWRDTWNFTGRDERELRACLDQLDAHRTEPPTERYDFRRGEVIEAEDRWLAAMLVYPVELSQHGRITQEPFQADAAWTVEGALALAEILPERLADLRDGLLARFSAGQA